LCYWLYGVTEDRPEGAPQEHRMPMRRHTAAAILVILATLGVALALGLRDAPSPTTTSAASQDAPGFDAYEVSEPVADEARAELDARLERAVGQADAKEAEAKGEDSLEFDEADGEDEDATGKVMVRSMPPGMIFIDGKSAGVRTPGAVEAKPGPHRVAVLFDGGNMSPTQNVTVKPGAQAQVTIEDTSKGKRKNPNAKQVTLKPAGLIVVTNFDKADVTVNGLAYPEYTEDGEEGMTLPAGGPYAVRVTYDGKAKDYTLSLRPYETRYLIVELSGFKGTGAPAPAPTPAKPEPEREKPQDEVSEDETGGRVTVYSKPRGQIIVDGTDQSKRAPNTVDVEVGRHEVQVRYDDGEVSEKKVVRVRKGSRIKLFFRQKK
jgi:hypothetical protein